MKYRDINWSIEINGEQASIDDSALDIIAEELQKGYTSGTFAYDSTNYAKCDELKEKLETELGRKVDYSVEEDSKGELNDLLENAKKNNDNYVAELIEEIFRYGFED